MNATLLSGWCQKEGKSYGKQQEEGGSPVRTASMCQSGGVQ
jgi:hypothetical protein